MDAKPQRYAIVGMRHRGAEQFVADLAPDAPLTLVREPDNKFDRNAVQVWAPDGDSFRHVGYVPKTQNAVLAAFIDANGKPWSEVGPADARADTASSRRFVSARIHKGSNVHPLAEVG